MVDRFIANCFVYTRCGVYWYWKYRKILWRSIWQIISHENNLARMTTVLISCSTLWKLRKAFTWILDNLHVVRHIPDDRSDTNASPLEWGHRYKRNNGFIKSHSCYLKMKMYFYFINCTESWKSAENLHPVTRGGFLALCCFFFCFGGAFAFGFAFAFAFAFAFGLVCFLCFVFPLCGVRKATIKFPLPFLILPFTVTRYGSLSCMFVFFGFLFCFASVPCNRTN